MSEGEVSESSIQTRDPFEHHQKEVRKEIVTRRTEPLTNADIRPPAEGERVIGLNYPDELNNEELHKPIIDATDQYGDAPDNVTFVDFSKRGVRSDSRDRMAEHRARVEDTVQRAEQDYAKKDEERMSREKRRKDIDHVEDVGGSLADVDKYEGNDLKNSRIVNETKMYKDDPELLHSLIDAWAERTGQLNYPTLFNKPKEEATPEELERVHSIVNENYNAVVNAMGQNNKSSQIG